MKIIIPMTGNGSRFVAAGYRELKPLIPVAGKPLIQWIVEGIFPGEKDFLFICRQEHLETIPGMERLLMELAPAGRIWPVRDWVKKGPVYDVLRASEAIGEEEACIINYCDVYFSWDWAKMKKKSLPYNFMVQDGLKVWVPTEMDYFCQWGTPEDLEEFLYWYGCLKGAYEA